MGDGPVREGGGSEGPVVAGPPGSGPLVSGPLVSGPLVTGRPGGGRPMHAAVLGSPIRHSLSPVLHRAAYGALGLRWTYAACEVDEAALPGFLDGLDASWAGLSLTMPLKRAVMPLLDEVSPLAVAVEAANTVLFDPGVQPADGAGYGRADASGTPAGRPRRRGENTDVPGMVAALAERGVDHAGTAAVLGGGATASSAVAALREVCTGETTVYARGAGRAAELHRLAERLGYPVRVAPWDAAAEGLAADLVVATTPPGIADALAASVPHASRERRGGTLGVLFDVVYDPWPTRLAAAWAAAGGAVVSGLDLLVHQAVLQVELMTGIMPAPLDVMRAAGERELANRAAAAARLPAGHG